MLGNGVVTELSVSKALPGITPAAFAAAVEATPSGFRPSGAPNPSRKPASGVPATRASRLFQCGNGKRIIARLFTRSNGHGRQAVGGQARTRSTFIATLREALGRSGKTLVAMRRALDEYGAGVLEAPDETVKVWSDLHLGHANIIAYQGRPFHNVHEMEGVLWANWQLGVDPEDTLVCVGDVAMGSGLSDDTWERVRAAPGRTKVLVVGNHDVTGQGGPASGGFSPGQDGLDLAGRSP